MRVKPNDGVRMCFKCLTRHRRSEECATMSRSDSEQRATCTSCNNEILPDTCYCGVAMVKHTVEDTHTPVPVGCTCAHKRPVDDMLRVAETQALNLNVCSNIWVSHIQATMLLMIDVVKRQQGEIEELQQHASRALVKCTYCGLIHRNKKCGLPEHPDADYDGIEEAYSLPLRDAKDMADRLDAKERKPFEGTEPPPRDKETTMFKPKPGYTEEETQTALNVPCMFCGMFPKAEKGGTVYCEDTCWGDVCPMFSPQKWIEENGDSGWRVRELRRRQGDDLE